jgi:hypothetical protein
MGNVPKMRCRGAARWALAVAALFAADVAAGQSLVFNGGFDSDLSGWAGFGGNTVIAWSPLDAGGSASSGSVRMENPAVGAAPSALEQCVEVGPGAQVRISARYLLEGEGNGEAAVFALQHQTPDCSGPGHFLPDAGPSGNSTGAWSELSATPTLGPDFRSIVLRVSVTGNGRVAHFDDLAVEVLEEGTGPAGECQPSATTLCLVDDRFEVRAKWRTASDSGSGQAVELNDGTTSGTGYFWFFNPTNVEVVVKVLDACVPPFNHFWVFAGGLTNQEVEIIVTDMATSATWTHVNPLGQVWETVTDTTALDVCD